MKLIFTCVHFSLLLITSECHLDQCHYENIRMNPDSPTYILLWSWASHSSLWTPSLSPTNGNNTHDLAWLISFQGMAHVTFFYPVGPTVDSQLRYVSLPLLHSVSHKHNYLCSFLLYTHEKDRSMCFLLMTILLKPKIPLRFLLCSKSMLDTLPHNPIPIRVISLPLFVHTLIDLPHRSQTLSQITPFLDSGSHLYTIASYVDFLIFSKITSPSLSHPFPAVLPVIQKQTGHKLGSVWVYLLSSQFLPQSPTKD